MTRTILIGAGRHGRRYYQRLMEHQDYELVLVIDTDESKLAGLGVPSTTNLEEGLKMTADLAIICTPADKLFEVSMMALGENMDVLCAKPGPMSTFACGVLREECEATGLDFAIDWPLFVTPEINLIDLQISSYGDLQEINTKRYVNGPEPACGVVWDLFTHDVALVMWQYCLFLRPTHVRCGKYEDTYVATLLDDNVPMARLSARYDVVVAQQEATYELRPYSVFGNPTINRILWDQIDRTVSAWCSSDDTNSHTLHLNKQPDLITHRLNKLPHATDWTLLSDVTSVLQALDDALASDDTVKVSY